jgi:hypothetical protein
MASYYIGMNSPSMGFGSGGNFFSQLGQIGPAWQNTMLQGLNTQNAFNEFQNKQIVDPYKVNAIASAYGLQGLQNLYDSRDAQQALNAQAAQMFTANMQDNLRSYQNTGQNGKEFGVGGEQNVSAPQPTSLTAPLNAQPTLPALYGGYAATAPQVTGTQRLTPSQQQQFGLTSYTTPQGYTGVPVVDNGYQFTGF